MASADPHDSRLIVRTERAVRQAHGKDLVGPDAGFVAIGTVNHIEQTFAVRPHKSCEASFYDVRRVAEAVRLAQSSGEISYNAQSVVPQRIDLDRLADAWGDDPVTDLCIHPGHLHARSTSLEQTIRGPLQCRNGFPSSAIRSYRTGPGRPDATR